MNKSTLIFFALGAAMIGLSQTMFIVDQTRQAIVLQLGQPVGDMRAPGLHFKLPLIQEVRYFDRFHFIRGSCAKADGHFGRC